MLQFESQTWPAPVRLAAWRDVLGRKLLNVEIEPKTADPFEVTACTRALPGLRFGWGKFDASINRRTKEIVAHDNDDFVLIVNLDDTLQVTQRRRHFQLRAGDAHAMTCAEEGSYVRPQAGRILCIRMEREALAAQVPELDDCPSRLIPRESAALKLLSDYVMTLDDNLPLTLKEVRDRVVSHVYGLAALTLGTTAVDGSGVSRRNLRAARLRTIKTYIDAHLGRRDLTIETVAAAHAVTERYVQRLFEAEGTTFTNYVLEHRLFRVFESLNDLRKSGRSIGSLALESGFGDVSYFNRVFRRRFGRRPRDLRSGLSLS
jgi:AraC-like DNA-binding protein